MFLLRYLIFTFFRFLLWLRYRVTTHGLDKVREVKGPTIILPNHPALVDPFLLMTRVWSDKQPRPMLWIKHFQNIFLWLMMKLFRAAEVPALDSFDAQAKEKAAKAIQDVIDGLKRGENFIMWPAGHIQRDGREHLGSAAALTMILRAVPEVNVVVVRTRGLWGSKASFAYTGKYPSIGGGVRGAIGWVLANLLFFMPRRSITQTYEVIDRSQLPPLEIDAVNRWFEAWYNAEGQEKPQFVPYHFLFGARTHEFPPPPVTVATVVDMSRIRPETVTDANHILQERVEAMRGEAIDAALFTPETQLESLGFNSLTRMDLQLAVERRFGFAAEVTPATVGEVYLLAAGLAPKGPPKPAPKEWFKSPNAVPVGIEGDTISEAFVHRALACRGDVVLADDLTGVLTYEKLLVGAITMAKRFAKLDGANIGLLLPASLASDVSLLALQLAGKVAVILNWTTGEANLAHAAKVMGLKHVITSKAFINRTAIVVPGTENIYLEELRTGIGSLEKLRVLLWVRMFPNSVRAMVPKIDPDQPAVVLFTSGSEKAPKAVPLTHRNLLSNIRSAFEVLDFTRQDAYLGFLPTFHSFGLTVTTLLPILGGMRVVRHPDPTDAAGLLAKLVGYRPTLLAGTPTFAGYILQRAEPSDLTSLRLVIVGAEKAPESLFQMVREKAPGASVLEGYGITECAPMVSANVPGRIRAGSIGQPFPGVEVRVVDLETRQPMPVGELGIALVSGPTIFPGYLGHDGEQPFVEMEGKRWYVTGDLARYDTEGYLYFSGRLKRFLKSGGEMISLPALEEPFGQAYPPTKDGPQVAIEGVERETGVWVVLFATVDISLREANQRLEAAGFHGVMRLNEVRKVAEIPKLGTGKTDYKVLRAQI